LVDLLWWLWSFESDFCDFFDLAIPGRWIKKANRKESNNQKVPHQQKE